MVETLNSAKVKDSLTKDISYFCIETRLYYYGARYYDPKTSLWLSADPILDSYLTGKPNKGVYSSYNLNLYAYSRQNPVKYNDPTGEWVWQAVKVALDAVAEVAIDYATAKMKGKSYGLKDAAKSAFRGAKDGVTSFGLGKVKKAIKAYKTYKKVKQHRKAVQRQYIPKKPLPSVEVGKKGRTKKTPSSDYPHSQIGEKISGKTGERYRQTRTWGKKGNRGYDNNTPKKDVDWYNHGRGDHKSPHTHKYNPKTGKRMNKKDGKWK